MAVSPQGVDPSGIDVARVEVGTTVDLKLEVGRIKPVASIIWLVNGERQTTENDAPGDNGDKTVSLSATYRHTFSREPASVTFSYMMVRMEDEQEEVVLPEADYATVTVQCMFFIIFSFLFL